MSVIKPSVYSERDIHVKNEKYLFISYSHRDADFVYEKLNNLYDKGLNFWYDREIDEGDSWSETAEAAISSEDCIGIIFFLSYNSVLSAAIEKEIEFATNKAKQLEKFLMIPINIGGGSYYQLVQQAFNSLINEKPDTLELKLPFSRVSKFVNYFNETYKFIPNDSTDLEDDIIRRATKHNAHLLSTSNSILIDLEQKKLIKKDGNSYKLIFSYFPTSRNYEVSFLGSYDIDSSTGEHHYKLNSEAKFDAELAAWKVLSVETEKIKALSYNYLKCCGYQNIDKEIEKIKEILSHFGHDVSFIVRLPTVEELLKDKSELLTANRTDYSDYDVGINSYQYVGFWALKDDNKVVVDQNRNIISESSLSIIAGLRLVIEIDIENLKKFNTEERNYGSY